MRDFTLDDFDLYKAARPFRRHVYVQVRQLPREERFALDPPVRRAAVSVSNNTVKGHGRWHYQENIQFCRITKGSTEELLDDFNTCLDEGYGGPAYVRSLKKEGYALIAGINAYIGYLERTKQEHEQQTHSLNHSLTENQMSLKATLRKAAGLLVELPVEEPELPADPAELDKRLAIVNKQLSSLGGDKPAPPTKTVEQIVQDTKGPKLDEIKVPQEAAQPLITADGVVDFLAVYKKAGIGTPAFTAEQMLELLDSLPKELPIETKRQTVKVTLNSMGKTLGASPETIVADATRKLAALDSFVDAVTRHTAEFISAAQVEIATLESKIQEKRKAIETAQHRQSAATKQCTAESDRIDDLLEFFSLDVAPSRYAPQSGNAPVGRQQPE
jgi:four helix bundle protein